MRKQDNVCDRQATREALEQRYSRQEALSSHIGHGIRDGITAHNKHESTIPLPPASRAGIIVSLADAIVQELSWNEADIDHLYVLLRRRLDPENHPDWL